LTQMFQGEKQSKLQVPKLLERKLRVKWKYGTGRLNVSGFLQEQQF